MGVSFGSTPRRRLLDELVWNPGTLGVQNRIAKWIGLQAAGGRFDSTAGGRSRLRGFIVLVVAGPPRGTVQVLQDVEGEE